MPPAPAMGLLRVAATYAGTIVGAGFASGQEIIQFFVSFGLAGLGGVVVAGFLFGWLGGQLLDLGRRLRAANSSQAIYYLCGRRLGSLLDIAVSFFLFGTLSVMLAGAATVCRDYFDWSYLTGSAAAGGIVGLTVLRGVRGIATANLIITPLLVLVIVTVSLYSLAHHAFNPAALAAAAVPASQAAPHWLLASTLYVSYNLMIGAPVLIPLGATAPDRRTCIAGGALGGFILGLLAACLVLVVMVHHPEILAYEVPILEVANRQHSLSSGGYTFILLAAMYTTALATLFGCSTKLVAATGLAPTVTVLVITVAALVCGQLGFANLIRLLFPLFGWAALWVMIRLAWVSLRDT